MIHDQPLLGGLRTPGPRGTWGRTESRGRAQRIPNGAARRGTLSRNCPILRMRRPMGPGVYARRGGGGCSRAVDKPSKVTPRSQLSGNRVTAWGDHQTPREKSSRLRQFADRPLLTPVPPRPHARFDAVAIELSLSAGFSVQLFASPATAEGRRWLRDRLRSRLKAKRSAP